MSPTSESATLPPRDEVGPFPGSVAVPQAAPDGAARVLSVDALRGFDMFWIVGAGSVVQALDNMQGNAFTRFLSTQLKHVTWEGFRFEDLIFPLFLFLVGVSIVFSLDKTVARDGKLSAVGRIFRRSILLFLLGVFHSGGLSERWPDIGLGGVLHRIAACYFFAALIYLCCGNRKKVLLGAAVALLVGYWAMLTFVPFPDLKLDKNTVTALGKKIGSQSPFDIARAVPSRLKGSYEEGRNLTNFVDFLFLPGRKANLYYINEGLLSTLPAIAICLFGALAGLLLKNPLVTPARKVAWLLAGGLALVAVGFLWSFQFPLIKRIWSSSFCVLASGYAALLLAAFYCVIDVWKFQRWCQPFVWIGMNSITIYLAVRIVDFRQVATRLVGGDVRAMFDARLGKGVGGLVIAIVSLALVFLFCWFLHRKKVFLRV